MQRPSRVFVVGLRWALFCLVIDVAQADDAGRSQQRVFDSAAWNRSASLLLLTDSEGADLPADAVFHDVPVVVRLDDEFFDFAAARPRGEDLCLMSEAGELLPHEIESWDREAGTAVV